DPDRGVCGPDDLSLSGKSATGSAGAVDPGRGVRLLAWHRGAGPARLGDEGAADAHVSELGRFESHRRARALDLCRRSVSARPGRSRAQHAAEYHAGARAVLLW